MITKIKNYLLELRYINTYYKYYKEQVNKYPSYSKDYYIHITPFNFGDTAIINNLVCKTGSINFLDSSKDCFIDIPQLCVSKSVLSCIASIFYEKLKDRDFYVYKTIKKEYAYSHFFNQYEFKIFKPTRFKKIGMIKNCNLLYQILEDLNDRRMQAYEKINDKEELEKVLKAIVKEIEKKLYITYRFQCKAPIQ